MKFRESLSIKLPVHIIHLEVEKREMEFLPSNSPITQQQIYWGFLKSGNICCVLVKPIRNKVTRMSGRAEFDQSALPSWMPLNNVWV